MGSLRLRRNPISSSSTLHTPAHETGSRSRCPANREQLTDGSEDVQRWRSHEWPDAPTQHNARPKLGGRVETLERHPQAEGQLPKKIGKKVNRCILPATIACGLGCARRFRAMVTPARCSRLPPSPALDYPGRRRGATALFPAESHAHVAVGHARISVAKSCGNHVHRFASQQQRRNSSRPDHAAGWIGVRLGRKMKLNGLGAVDSRQRPRSRARGGIPPAISPASGLKSAA